jgi:hypothetical protein
MPINLRISDLAPVGLIVESITQLGRPGRYPGGDMSSVWIAFAARSQPVCSRGFGPAVLGSERTASDRGTPVLFQHPALPEADFCRTL